MYLVCHRNEKRKKIVYHMLNFARYSNFFGLVGFLC